MENSSHVKVFTLSGLNGTRGNNYLYFSLTLMVYMLILFVNLTVIFTILLERALHEPMYLFLCNLCMNGLYGAAGFYPKFLSDLLSDVYMISYEGCFIQAFVIYTAVKCDFLTLAAMAYDRYVAICKPLEYHSIMTIQLVIKLIIFSWFFSFFTMSLSVGLASRLPLCGSHIDKFYCENWSIVKLSCESTIYNNINGTIIIFMFFVTVICIICSYIKLIIVCTKSRDDRVKFMQTCLPHVLTLTNFTVTLLFDTMYSRYGSKDVPQAIRNFFALQFIIIPPIFNPLIYGLKLTEVRKRLLRPCLRGL
ncbi:olfactory receptor 52E8-like [Megalops cyprinoides]|uniref:olfactory receptor 52E8-like n=1 Tax=Megalops cyprinoides TaxID=118141 RepID=UPI00186484A2|nr:olfactory receptor 52E8-like [Megalops cyprinoides]